MVLQEGVQAIHIAAINGHRKLIEILVDEYHVDPKATTPVKIYTIEKQYREINYYLLKLMASIIVMHALGWLGVHPLCFNV